MKAIEGINFQPHGYGDGNYHAVVTCNDGTDISIVQCDGTGDCQRIVRMWDNTGQGCFYGNINGEQVFEILDYSRDDAEGWLTDIEVVERIMEHGGIASQK